MSLPIWTTNKKIAKFNSYFLEVHARIVSCRKVIVE